MPDDRPKLSELIKFHEEVIKGQPKECPWPDADTIRKIRSANTTDEGMSHRAFEEHSTMLNKMKGGTRKIKGILIIQNTTIS